jgi:hypothetical protein
MKSTASSNIPVLCSNTTNQLCEKISRFFFCKTKAKALSYFLIKKKVGQFLIKNRTKIHKQHHKAMPSRHHGDKPKTQELQSLNSKKQPYKMRQPTPALERRHRDRYERSEHGMLKQ